MAVKGLCWLLIGAITISVIVACCFLLVYERAWCNAKLRAGECEKYELDHTCYCFDMVKEEEKIVKNELLFGLYERAVNQCRILEGRLATPDNIKLTLFLAKKIYSMGVDNAYVGLERINSTWFWMEADGAKAATVEWRNDFPPSPQDQYGMLSVETFRKEAQEEYFGYKNYNYQHYIENDPTYQWFGFTTSDNRYHGDYDKAFFICHYVDAPTQMPVQSDDNLVTTMTNNLPVDPCFCSSHEQIVLPKLEDSATFTSPKYPSNYCSDSNCRWMVSTNPGLTIKLEWLVFSVEKNMDFVYTYDGDSDDNPRIDICTSSSCRTQKSSSHLMQIHFHADHVTTDLGFKARVTAIDPEEMVGSVTYSAKRDDDKIPAGAEATLSCPPNHVTAVSNAINDSATCKSPHWEPSLERCISVCELSVAAIMDFTAPIHICIYEKEYSSIGRPKGQIMADAFVPSGDNIQIRYYENNKMVSVESYLCNSSKWSPGRPICHTKGILLLSGRKPELYLPIQQTTAFLDINLDLWDVRCAVLSNSHILAIDNTGGLGTKLIDLSTSKVSDGPNMLYDHEYGAVSVFGTEVWACGGHRKECEAFNQSSWNKKPELQTQRHTFALVTLGGDLYAIAGFEQYMWGNYLTSVEKYSPETDAWKYVAELKSRRSRLAAAAFDSKIVACGGFVSSKSLNTCEVYDPTLDMWSGFGSMLEEKQNFLLIAFDVKLYAFVETSTEIYDSETGRWIEGIELLEPRSLTSGVVVPDYGNY